MSDRLRTSAWLQAEANNQTRFRAVNESIDDAADLFGDAASYNVYVCECGDGECLDPIKLTRAEYAVVRSEATHFAIATNHENPELDRVVSEHGRFAIVQKTLAVAVRLARETDPRR